MQTHGDLQAHTLAELRAQKARHGISVEEMAEKSGLRPDYISRRLRDRVDVSLHDLERMCATVGVRAIVYLVPEDSPDPVGTG